MKQKIRSVVWKIRKQKTPNQKTGKEKKSKSEHRLSSLWDNFKNAYICIMGVLAGEKRDQEIKNLFKKIMIENFPNLVKEVDIQVQEVQRVPNMMNPKRSTARHIIIKMPKVKDNERILKAAREKQLATFKGAPIRLLAAFSTETAGQKGVARNIQSYEK